MDKNKENVEDHKSRAFQLLFDLVPFVLIIYGSLVIFYFFIRHFVVTNKIIRTCFLLYSWGRTSPLALESPSVPGSESENPSSSTVQIYRWIFVLNQRFCRVVVLLNYLETYLKPMELKLNFWSHSLSVHHHFNLLSVTLSALQQELPSHLFQTHLSQLWYWSRSLSEMSFLTIWRLL